LLRQQLSHEPTLIIKTLLEPGSGSRKEVCGISSAVQVAER